MPVSKKALYLNADKTKVVEENDPEAAFVLVGVGGYISEADAKKYKVQTTADQVYDAKADHEAKHGGETPEQAAAARQRMLDGQPDPDGPAVEGERGALDAETGEPKAAKARPNKAAKAPENKSE